MQYNNFSSSFISKDNIKTSEDLKKNQKFLQDQI